MSDNRKYMAALLAASALALTACGGGSSGSSSGGAGGGGGTPEATVSGTAAVGQAITNATVTATCQDGTGFTLSPVTTDSNGKWSGKVASDQLPCLLTLSNGTPDIELTSMVFTAGTVNISPLTQLALVLSKADASLGWKNDKNNWPAKSVVESSTATLVQTLKDKGYADAILSGSPFTTAFDANGEGWDALLDNIRELVEDPEGSIDGYDELAQLLADGNLNNLPDYEDPTEPQEPVDPELPSNISVLTAFAGTYTVSGTATEPVSRGTATRDHARGTITLSDNGDVDFDTGISFTGADINAIYDRRNICDLEPPLDNTSCRVHVNYDADDSGRKLEIYLNQDKTTVLEIRYQDNQGGLTRAAIGDDSEEPQEPVEPGAELLNGKNGIAIVHNGHTWVNHSAEAPAAYLSGGRYLKASNYDTSNSSFIDATLFKEESLLSVQLGVAGGEPGTQYCDSTTQIHIVTYKASPPQQKNWTATTCELQVGYYAGNGAIEGHIVSATLSNDKDEQTAELNGGQFRIFVHAGTAGSAPEVLPDNARISINVTGGETKELAAGQYFQGVNVFGSGPLNDGSQTDGLYGVNRFSLNINGSTTLESRTPGTYNCGQGETSSVHLELKLGYNSVYSFSTSNNGGSCTLVIDNSAGRRYIGSYQATLVAVSNAHNSWLTEAERTVMISGKLRNFTIQTFHADNEGDEGALGAVEHGITMTIDDGNTHFEAGERFRIASEASSNGNNGYFSSTFDDLESPNNSLRMVWSGIPMIVGSYDCNEEVGALRPSIILATPANIPYSVTSGQSLIEGASCTLTVTSVDNGVVEGTYTATLVARNIAPVLPDNDGTISVSGEFRYPYTP